MRNILAALFFLSLGASAQLPGSNSFETNYNLLQKKIEALKEKGQKINEDTRKEIDGLMAQMNHEHTELRRELEKKNQILAEKVHAGVKTEQDWSRRASLAYHAVADGMSRAWENLRKGSD